VSPSFPKIRNLREKTAKVSGEYLKYSHFLETRAGDWRDQHCVVWDAVSLNFLQVKQSAGTSQ
jgi:hypothetical protein